MASESYSFSQVPRADIPRSSFNRSHGHKTTFDSGYLVPIFVDEALPGDTFSVKLSAFARLATPLFPIMDNLFMDFFFFAVPNRLLWNNWQKFMGEKEPNDSTDYLVPEIDAPVGGFLADSIFDYMGIPPGVSGISVSALPLRAYNLIYNEWFRDENLIPSVAVPKTDGPDTYTGYQLLRRGKRHDYFTSCLPWPQKGAGVEVPIGGTAPIIADPVQGGLWNMRIGSANGAQQDFMIQGDQGGVIAGTNPPGGTNPIFWPSLPISGAVADLSSATAVTINDLRMAFQWQKLQERDARGGTRYTEILRAHFGVQSPDARLQRPEFLGGGSVPVVINPVAQTSFTGATPDPSNVKGSLAAYGVVGVNGVGFTKSFVEHCTLIGLVMVRADLSYQQGLHKMWSRRTKLDFYWPALSHIGEQAVLKKEIYAQGTSVDEEVFGYQERWAEYRYFPSLITGKFRSTNPASLDAWHLAQDFASVPTLSQAFIEENPPVERIVAVTSEPEFLFDSHFQIRCVRPMPAYSVPGLIDHF